MTLFVGSGEGWELVAARVGDCDVCGADAFLDMGAVVEINGRYVHVCGKFCDDHDIRDLVRIRKEQAGA